MNQSEASGNTLKNPAIRPERCHPCPHQSPRRRALGHTQHAVCGDLKFTLCQQHSQIEAHTEALDAALRRACLMLGFLLFPCASLVVIGLGYTL